MQGQVMGRVDRCGCLEKFIPLKRRAGKSKKIEKGTFAESGSLHLLLQSNSRARLIRLWQELSGRNCLAGIARQARLELRRIVLQFSKVWELKSCLSSNSHLQQSCRTGQDEVCFREPRPSR